MLRYWDGVQWTTHTSPRRRPGLEQTSSTQGQGPGSSTAGRGYGGASQGGQQQYGSGDGGGAYGGGQQHGGQQSQGPYAGGWNQSAPQYYGQDSRATTPDGQQLSGWWRRFLARLLDGLIMTVVALVLVPVAAPDLFGDINNWVDDVVVALQGGSSVMPQLPNSVYVQLATLGIASGIIYLIYEIVMLKVASGTLGKLALGIRVRLRDQPGPLSWSTSALRGLVWRGPDLVSNVPYVGLLGTLFTLLNGLWPLWDSKKQSLNDKVAKTNVVRKS